MQCASCKKDFHDSENKKPTWTGQNDHFMKPYRLSGYTCPSCGFNNTVIHIPCKTAFIRTARDYNTVDEMVINFAKELSEFLNKKNFQKHQLNLLDEEE